MWALIKRQGGNLNTGRSLWHGRAGMVRKVFRMGKYSVRNELIFFLFFSFFFLRATPAAYGNSQARDHTGATATSLHHSHRNVGSELHLRLTPPLTATLDAEARDRTRILMDPSRICFCWAMHDRNSWWMNLNDCSRLILQPLNPQPLACSTPIRLNPSQAPFQLPASGPACPTASLFQVLFSPPLRPNCCFLGETFLCHVPNSSIYRINIYRSVAPVSLMTLFLHWWLINWGEGNHLL